MGGEPELLTTPDPEQGGDHQWPEFLPGGQHVLFSIVANPAEESQIAVLSLETGEYNVVLRGESFPRYSPTGHLLYGVEGNLWAVGFDLSRLETVGEPVPVQEGVLTKRSGSAGFAVSENGSLVYVSGDIAGVQRRFVWVDRDGNEEVVAAEPRSYASVQLSPDGRRVVTSINDPENRDLVVYDLVRNASTRLTFDPGPDRDPIWTPDGERIVFASARDGSSNLFVKAADDTGEVERLTTSANRNRTALRLGLG